MANNLQMLVRYQGFSEWDVYRFYNANHPGYPDNLPPPPNPDKLQQFFMKAVEEIIHQKNRENSPGAASGRREATP